MNSPLTLKTHNGEEKNSFKNDENGDLKLISTYIFAENNVRFHNICLTAFLSYDIIMLYSG